MDDQRQALLAVRGALALGGKLIVDLPVWAPEWPAQPGTEVRVLDGHGERSAVIHRCRQVDPTRQLVEQTVACEWLTADGEVASKQYFHLTERYSTPAEVALLMETCGFAATMYGGFDHRPLLPGATRLVVEAERCL